METDQVYLKPNALVEPLVSQWYAWSCLIPPATRAMYMANSHVKLMQSFAANPQLHIAALKNPAMASGPFIQYAASEAGAIRALLEKTKREQAPLLELAEAIQSLDRLLGGEAEGDTLEPFYERIPEALGGYVELIYDLKNHASIRFIESLLYKSRYYNESSQAVALSLIDADHRPFVFNTPRLERDGVVHLNLPFADARLDELFRMRSAPRSYARIKDLLGVRQEDEETFRSLFTAAAPKPPEAYDGQRVRVRYFGHACLLVQTKDVSILCDPLISYKHDAELFRYGYEDLPEVIDYALITHCHQDHLMLEMLLQLRHKVRNVVVPRSSGSGLADPSIKLLLQTLGFRSVIEIDELEVIGIEGGEIIGVPFLGEHADLNIRAKTAYQINLGDRHILCMADSNNIDPKLYGHLHGMLGDADMVFIGMECDGAPLSWIYGPFLTMTLTRKMDQARRLNGSDRRRALDIVTRFNAKEVYVYAMGQEPWLTFVTGIHYTDTSRPITESSGLVEDCRQRGIVSERLFGHKDLLL